MDDTWLNDVIEGLASELPNKSTLLCPVCNQVAEVSPPVQRFLDSGKAIDGTAYWHDSWDWNGVGKGFKNTGHWVVVVPDGLTSLPKGFEVVETGSEETPAYIRKI